MDPFRSILWVATAAAALICCGCAARVAEMTPPQAYREALDRPGHEFVAGSPRERAAVAHFTALFADLSEQNIRARVRHAYAQDAFFYDTLKVLRGAGAIEEYLVETAHNTESVNATVEDIARSGADYYVRWTMEIRLKKFQRGRTLTSVGMTHLRFGPDGKIILHHDYWDASSGFFEHVPGIGAIIRWIRRMF